MPDAGESLLQFPCSFPVKVMGQRQDGFAQAMIELALRFDPQFDPNTGVELRDSRAGTYLGVTLNITATSREQLDGLYRALTAHPLVRLVL
ncbi:MAG: YbeD family protein [Aquabacterium sp.]